MTHAMSVTHSVIYYNKLLHTYTHTTYLSVAFLSFRSSDTQPPSGSLSMAEVVWG